MNESDDDEPYGVPIGLPRKMWPKPMPTIEEQERRRGEAFYWGLKRARTTNSRDRR